MIKRNDRYNGFVVVFEYPIKDEDSENIKSLLLAIKGVISVEPIVDDISSICARSQVRRDLTKKIWEALEK